MLTGLAGTGVGSRIVGHERRGGTKMRKEQQKHIVVSFTNEYRTLKTCLFCFGPVRLARRRRLVNDPIRSLRLYGGIECVNPVCVSFKAGYTIKARDAHSVVVIALAGASNLLSPERETLPPFARFAYIPPIPAIATATSALSDFVTKNASPALETLSPQTSIDDATGAPTNVGL
ncbi:hypothetical protein BGZ99_002455 [Dissophora globulifera]|uniref:Uncharacterized protein n=1 Tax=Dissophora globulifera TaxID=979702 RepID=A0A9P6RPM1_9FUNG|nr:hypothetical protein BGZ99_002455 [Dissophora globulifera]